MNIHYVEIAPVLIDAVEARPADMTSRELVREKRGHPTCVSPSEQISYEGQHRKEK